MLVRSLRLANYNGNMICKREKHNGTNKAMRIISVLAKLETGLLKGIDEFKNADPNFRICIVSQSSRPAMSINEDLIRKVPRVEDQDSNRFRQWNDQGGML